MQDLRRNPSTHPGVELLSLGSVLRFFTGVVGIILVCFGGFGAIRLFFGVLAFIKDPQQHASIIQRWSELLAVNGVSIPIGGAPFPVAGLVATWFLFMGLYLLMRLLLLIMKGGLSLLTWATGGTATARPARARCGNLKENQKEGLPPFPQSRNGAALI